ncbi:hypothetical protein GGS21DRAFT_369667 [Xylaria nigripes]|nr:hypothetical protein GGS21DRAFT_369667 [Xylaria nigripes]
MLKTHSIRSWYLLSGAIVLGGRLVARCIERNTIGSSERRLFKSQPSHVALVAEFDTYFSYQVVPDDGTVQTRRDLTAGSFDTYYCQSTGFQREAVAVIPTPPIFFFINLMWLEMVCRNVWLTTDGATK